MPTAAPAFTRPRLKILSIPFLPRSSAVRERIVVSCPAFIEPPAPPSIRAATPETIGVEKLVPVGPIMKLFVVHANGKTIWNDEQTDVMLP